MDAPARIEYRAPVAPPASIALFSFMFLSGLFGLILSLVQGGPWLFMLLWIAIVGGCAFMFLAVNSHAVVIDDGMFSWWTAFSHGVLPMSDLEKVVGWWGGQLHVFEFRGGKRVRVGVMQGYVAFVEQVQDAYPSLLFPPLTYARFVDHMRVGPRGRW